MMALLWLAACAPKSAMWAEVDVFVPPLGEDRDFDQDGILDEDEDWLGTLFEVPDTDDDGIIDGDELLIGTDPTLVDTDLDGIEDGEELLLGFDPIDPDTDGGGAWDGAEILDGTEPGNPRDDILLGAFVGGGGCEHVLPAGAPLGLLAWLAGLLVAARGSRR
jgi:hypothetical protein